ncbi:MAG: hypothetical protein M3450_07285 [Actinomycetota bacterium]|nr:hypothetical protein [Actinomycetota bacterium]
MAILVAIASAVGIAWFAEAGVERDFLGMRSQCVSSLEEDGDISPCGRVQAGVRVNALAHIALTSVLMAAVVRRREQMVHALAALAVSVMVTGLCYVFMRSWEFGRL